MSNGGLRMRGGQQCISCYSCSFKWNYAWRSACFKCGARLVPDFRDQEPHLQGVWSSKGGNGGFDGGMPWQGGMEKGWHSAGQGGKAGKGAGKHGGGGKGGKGGQPWSKGSNGDGANSSPMDGLPLPEPPQDHRLKEEQGRLQKLIKDLQAAGMDDAVVQARQKLATLAQKEEEDRPYHKVVQSAASQLAGIRTQIGTHESQIVEYQARIVQWQDYLEVIKDELAALQTKEQELALICEKPPVQMPNIDLEGYLRSAHGIGDDILQSETGGQLVNSIGNILEQLLVEARKRADERKADDETECPAGKGKGRGKGPKSEPASTQEETGGGGSATPRMGEDAEMGQVDADTFAQAVKRHIGEQASKQAIDAMWEEMRPKRSKIHPSD